MASSALLRNNLPTRGKCQRSRRGRCSRIQCFAEQQKPNNAAIGAALGAGAAGFVLAFASRGGISLSDERQFSVSYDEALRSGKPTVVEFYTDWCDICKRSAKRVKGAKEGVGDTVNLVMLNVDNPKWAQEAKEEGVTGIPHFSFLAGDGTRLSSAVGDVPERVLSQSFSALASGMGSDQLPSEGRASYAANDVPAPSTRTEQVSPRAHGYSS